ncbi:hypothetical protein [Xanthomonas theicola]|uniref:Uncharacterized protein n=1 Tax=Xanthomonas theicola TaxID=56464 RepID=A0A2S6ZDB4_9XANT|nr:hypothetical protein [Xanthomonas theicola]PPT90232.1 hypothetical protein XthCFBP4691_13430 [Xanthomonas theicola]QNH25345.1 hypothetical protein G4Q83_12165 [Xanthomonas theicola]
MMAAHAAAMDEIAEYLWQAPLAPPPSTAAAPPPVDVVDAAAPAAAPPVQPCSPKLDQLLHALSDPNVLDALIKLLRPR